MAKKYTAYDVNKFPLLGLVVKCSECGFKAVGAQFDKGNCPKCSKYDADIAAIKNEVD